jgi:hypothetical protein
MKVVRSLLVPAALIAILGCSARSKTSSNLTPPKFATTSTITTGKDGDAVFPVVDNGRFYVDPEYRTADGQTIKLTIQEHIVTHVRTDRECCEARVTASGFINDKPAWTLAKADDEAEMDDPFYRTVRHGCCAASTRYSYFDPLTGRQAFIATEPIAHIEVVSYPPTDLDRFVVLNRISEPGDDEFALQIQYGPQSGPSQVVFLTHSGQDAAGSSVSLRFLSKVEVVQTSSGLPTMLTIFPPGYPDRRVASTQDISGFLVVLTVEGYPSIQIPVVKDRLDLEHTPLPKGFRISDTVPADDAAYFKDMMQ